MKKIVFCLSICILLFCKAHGQNPKNASEQAAIKLIESALFAESNAWNAMALIKHDRLDTLFTLPYECEQYKTICNSYPDSLSYYIDRGEENMKNGESVKDNGEKIKYWLIASQQNRSLKKVRIEDFLASFHPENKGWRMRCRISSNDKALNMEFHFDKNLTKITQILRASKSIVYEQLLQVKSYDKLLSLKGDFEAE